MKKVILKTGIIFLIMSMMGVGCNEETKDDKVSIVLSLDEMSLITGYEGLSLIGTEWKLIGFADVAKNTVKIAEPQHENCYRLTFNPDGTLSGETSTNQAGGGYEVDIQNNKLKIFSFGGNTMINELYDGRLYVKSMLEIESFSIMQKGLALYYNNKKHFLLFKPVTL